MNFVETMFTKAAREYALNIGRVDRNCMIEKMVSGDVDGIQEACIAFEKNLFDFIFQNCDSRITDFRRMLLCAGSQLSFAAKSAGVPSSQDILFFSGFYYAVDITEEIENMNKAFINLASEYTQYIKASKDLSNHSETTKKCCDYIRIHIYDKPTLTDISNAIHFSESYISHKFKEELGMTVRQYILQEKVTVAKSLLITNIPISSISNNLGFSTQSHFTSVFKEKTGITPHCYRKDYLNNLSKNSMNSNLPAIF